MEKNIDGMVNQMNKISASFSALKILALVSVVCMMATAVAGFYLYMQKMSELDSRIYIIDQGSASSAFAQDQKVTRKDEIRAHVELFHNYMFNLPPSREMITVSINKALELADNSAHQYYNDVQERGFYKRLVSTNSYQIIDIQDIDIDMSAYPYRCRVANSVRSAKNLNGLMIENFEVVENNLIETREK